MQTQHCLQKVAPAEPTSESQKRLSREPHILCSSQFKCSLYFLREIKHFLGFPLANQFFLVFLGISRYFPWKIKVFPLANHGISLGKSIFPVFLEEFFSLNCHHWNTNKQTCPCMKATKLLIFWNVKILPLTSYSFLFVRYCKAQNIILNAMILKSFKLLKWFVQKFELNSLSQVTKAHKWTWGFEFHLLDSLSNLWYQCLLYMLMWFE